MAIATYLIHFNSRPSARGDRCGCAPAGRPADFNSRPSARGDRLSAADGSGDDISIHAPPRGATRSVSRQRLPHRTNFNSRPSARGDQTTSGLRTAEIFQFTPLREGRRLQVEQNSLNTLFQFTPLREGRLAMLGERADTRRISIHAPPRGATHGGGVLLVSLEMISIHAPPRGATKRHSTSWKRSLFQFTPLREGRRAPRSHATPPTNFNSRPSARGDPRRNAPKSFRPPFQFTPLREGRLLGTMAMARGCLISIHAPPRGATAPNSKKS